MTRTRLAPPENAPTRRQFFTHVGLAGGAAVAGCVGPLDTASDETDDPAGTEDMPNRLWFRAVDPPADDSDADPIEYASLSPEERALVDTAMADGEYTVPTDESPPALESLRDRIEARTGSGRTLVVYLVRDGGHYRVGFVNGDHIIASPDYEG